MPTKKRPSEDIIIDYFTNESKDKADVLLAVIQRVMKLRFPPEVKPTSKKSSKKASATSTRATQKASAQGPEVGGGEAKSAVAKMKAENAAALEGFTGSEGE